ncbi:MAG: hypothetical protein OEY86_15255 [Nitrospira sp.]|nr:hypothetical protein [Nitrospira sp.]
MSLQALTHIDPNRFFQLPKFDGTDIQRLNTQVGGVAVSNDFSGRLSVTTAEGDRITLTADLETDFRAVNFNSQSSAGGTTVGVAATYKEFAFRNEFSVAVEGNLNEQELQDLETIFQKAANIFKHFLKGQDEVSLGKITNLADRFSGLSSLSGLDLSLDLERSVTQVAAQIASEFTSDGVGGPGESFKANGVSAPPSSSNPAEPSRSDQGNRLGLGPLHFSAVASLVQQMLEALNESHLEPRKIQEHLPSLFARLREEVGEDLRQEHGRKHAQSEEPVNGSQRPFSVNAAVALAYESVRESSASLSLQG